MDVPDEVDLNFLTSRESEDREEEIATILELGGDPSFLLDLAKSKVLSSRRNNCDISADRVLEPRKVFEMVDVPDLAETLQAAGEDPFFLPNISEVTQSMTLTDDEEEHNIIASFEQQREELEAMGGDPSFLEPISIGLLTKDITTMGRDSSILKSGPTISHGSIIPSNGENDQQPYYTTVQGEIFDNKMDEIEALGGDPSFLEKSASSYIQPELRNLGYSTDVPLNLAGKPAANTGKVPYYTATEGDSFDSIRDEVEALGGDPFFLVGGEESSNHAGWDDVLEEVGESALPSSLLSGPSFLLDIVQREENETTIPSQPTAAKNDTPRQRHSLRKDPITNEVIEDEVLSEEEELLSVGGDPAFLDSYDKVSESDSYEREVQRAEIEEIGGDTSFL